MYQSKKRAGTLYEFFRPKWEEGDLLIWGTDGCICKNDIKNSIVIQHGIFGISLMSQIRITIIA